MTGRHVIALATALGMLAACGAAGDDGGSPGDDTNDPTVPPADSTVASTPDPPAEPIAMPARALPGDDATTAGSAVTAFGFDIYTAAAPLTGDADNLVLSPLSIAIALAMLQPGANGEALEQLDELLRIGDAAEWHASMNALEQSLEARVAELPFDDPSGEQDPGEFHANIANAAFLQPGYPFLPGYLDTIGANYGAVLEELDFLTDQEAAAARINEFIADETDDKITDLLQPTDIDPATVLALVNALLLQASWETQFAVDATADDEFTLAGGATVTVPMMHGRSDRSATGDGWVGASKALVGGIRLDVVLPDDGHFADVEARLGEVFDELAASPRPGGELAVPRFETRVTVGLTDALRAAGLTAPFSNGQLMGIADDPQLVLDKAFHQTWLSVDEEGIEAAAATVLLVMATSAPIDEPIAVVLDRPFVLRLVDTDSGATLFLGRVMDPTG